MTEIERLRPPDRAPHSDAVWRRGTETQQGVIQLRSPAAAAPVNTETEARERFRQAAALHAGHVTQRFAAAGGFVRSESRLMLEVRGA